MILSQEWDHELKLENAYGVRLEKCLSTSLLWKFYYFHMHFNSDLYGVFTNILLSGAKMLKIC